MKKIEKTPFSISPGTGMMDIIGHAGYSFDYAIADLIDNCIAAHAKNITIYFDYKCENPYLYILDDGEGMSIQKLKEAAVIGFQDIDVKRTKDDLGRYSTGLKSATRSFCNNIVIISKEEDNKTNIIQIDYKHIHDNKKWEAFELNEFKLSNLINRHGTMVYCDNLYVFNNNDLDNIYQKLDILENSLAHIFGKYILKDKIRITIQTVGSKPIIIKGWNPFGLIDNKATKKIYEKKQMYNKSTFDIKAYILPVYNNLSYTDQKYMEGNKGLLEQSGFYIYRNERLISEGGWLNIPDIKLDEKTKYARIEVNIPSTLDEEFSINFSKNKVIIPDDLIEVFKNIAKKARKESKNSANYIKHPEFKKKIKVEEEKIWKISNTNKGMVLTINEEHPLINEICKDMTLQTKQKLLNTLAKTIPVNMIQTQDVGTSSYTENEMMSLIDDMYIKLKSDGLNLSDIKKRLMTLEPFKNNTEFLIKYFEEVED